VFSRIRAADVLESRVGCLFAGVGTVVPWRDRASSTPFTVEGYRKANGEEDPRAVPHGVAGLCET
jgi:hypothetical protein